MATILLGLSSPAGQAASRCEEDVCISLTLPPHIRRINVRKQRPSGLRYMIRLPEKAPGDVTVRVFLLRETPSGEPEPVWDWLEKV